MFSFLLKYKLLEKMYNLINFSICIHPCNHHLPQVIECFQHIEISLVFFFNFLLPTGSNHSCLSLLWPWLGFHLSLNFIQMKLQSSVCIFLCVCFWLLSFNIMFLRLVCVFEYMQVFNTDFLIHLYCSWRPIYIFFPQILDTVGASSLPANPGWLPAHVSAHTTSLPLLLHPWSGSG